MKMLKQKMRKKLEVSTETPWGALETVEKPQINSSCKAEETITVQKLTKSNKWKFNQKICRNNNLRDADSINIA